MYKLYGQHEALHCLYTHLHTREHVRARAYPRIHERAIYGRNHHRTISIANST